MNKTMVIGASTKPNRYSNRAIRMLRAHNIRVVALGLKEGVVDDVEITTTRPMMNDIHTITLYINPKNQLGWYDYILNISPQRVIFNPGTENPELTELLDDRGISNENSCTLVLLSTDQYSL